MALSFVNGLPPLLSILCQSLPCVYSDVCRLLVSFDNIFVSQSHRTVFGSLLSFIQVICPVQRSWEAVRVVLRISFVKAFCAVVEYVACAVNDLFRIICMYAIISIFLPLFICTKALRGLDM